jgi:hypothetical protein
MRNMLLTAINAVLLMLSGHVSSI